MNRPLAKALPTSCLAKSTSCCGSAGDAINEIDREISAARQWWRSQRITRMPEIFDSGPVDSSKSCCAVFFRSLHGFVTIPPKPPAGDVNLKDALALGEAAVDVVHCPSRTAWSDRWSSWGKPG